MLPKYDLRIPVAVFQHVQEPPASRLRNKQRLLLFGQPPGFVAVFHEREGILERQAEDSADLDDPQDL